ncbi:MAG TPA: methyl-accepting chemotaxis protein [Bdellovibrio sp.]|uniref:methyl-accepting chemotaxis protein n=1 Tax=Bdellovibrio sp. TaxID=28201 RepID=UPI002F1A98A5
MNPQHSSNWFKGLQGRLFKTALIPLLGFAVMFFIAQHGFNMIYALVDSSEKEVLPNIITQGEMRQSRNKFGYNIWAALDESHDAKLRSFYVAQAKESIKEFNENYVKYSNTSDTPEEAKIHEAAKPEVAKLQKEMSDVEALVESSDPQKWEQAKTLLREDFRITNLKVADFNTSVISIYEKQASADEDQAAYIRSTGLKLLSGVILFASLVVFGFMLFIGARLSKYLSGLVSQIADSGSRVKDTISHLNHAGTSLVSSSTQAAASLEETVASLEELSSMVKLNSEHAKQAADLSANSRLSAEKGEEEIKSLVASMHEINQSSRKIEEIINVIDDIAFQTNLLALNAAVEAARAGEQGRGFAVVAEAVRSLAARSASAAKDITNLIKDSVAHVEHGTEIADRSGVVLTNIVTSVKKVAELNNEISVASSEQAAGLEQISSAMNQLDQATQANAASAEEISATTSDLKELSDSNHKVTMSLREVISGTHTDTGKAHQESSHHAPLNVVKFPEKSRVNLGSAKGF